MNTQHFQACFQAFSEKHAWKHGMFEVLLLFFFKERSTIQFSSASSTLIFLESFFLFENE